MTCVPNPSGLRSTVFAFVAAIAATIAVAAKAEVRVIEREAYTSDLKGLTVAFLARDLETGIDHILQGSDLDTRHAPWSTFKIPNLIIALETGVSPALDTWRDWDPKRRPAAAHWPAAWKEGQTLGTAFARSSAWYFRDLALDVGGPAYRARLSEWGYGNASVPDDSDDFWKGGNDDFWNGGSLRISVREQVNFLEALLSKNLRVSAASLDALDMASLAARAPGVSLHGKTGSGPDDPANLDGAFSGWYAGYLKRDDRAPVVFALHVSSPTYAALRDFRKAFSITLLRDASLAPGMTLPSK